MDSEATRKPSDSGDPNGQIRRRRSNPHKSRKRRDSEREVSRKYSTIPLAIAFVVVAIIIGETYLSPELKKEPVQTNKYIRATKQALAHPIREKEIAKPIASEPKSDLYSQDKLTKYSAVSSVDWNTCLKKNDSIETKAHVIVSPGSHYQGSYSDQQTWVCFRLETPGSDEDLYAYSFVDGLISEKMKQALLDSEDFKMPMTLTLTGKGTQDGFHLFEINEVIALDWVK